MKTIIKIFGFVSLASIIFSANIANAQQEGLYTQYMFNKMVFNPATVGTQDAFVASLHARTQWTGMKDAPETQTLLVESPIKRTNMGVGLSIVNDVAGPLTQRNILAYYSYSVKFSQTTKLSFGLNTGIYAINANLPDIELSTQEYDPAFADIYKNAVKYNVGFGMYFNTKNWYCGISAPKLYNTMFLGKKEHDELNLKSHYYFLSGATIKLSNKVDLKPSVMVRKVVGAPIGMDLSALLELNKKYWAGLSGRWEEGASLIVGGTISEGIRVGYSYDVNLNSLTKVNSGSHEVFISYDFPVKSTYNPFLQ